MNLYYIYLWYFFAIYIQDYIQNNYNKNQQILLDIKNNIKINNELVKLIIINDNTNNIVLNKLNINNNTNNNLIIQINNNQEINNNLTTQINNNESKNKHLITQINDNESKNKDLITQINNYESKNNNLITQINNNNNTNNYLVNTNKDLTTQINNNEKTNNNLITQINNNEKINKNLITQINNNESKNKHLITQINDNEKTNNNLITQISNNKKINNNLITQINNNEVKNKDLIIYISNNEKIKSNLTNFIKNNEENISNMNIRNRHFIQMFYILKKMILSLDNFFSSYEINDILVLISVLDKNIINTLDFDDSKKKTLLHYAVETKQKDVINILIDNMNLKILEETEPNNLFGNMMTLDMKDQVKKILKIIDNPDYIFNNFDTNYKKNQNYLMNILNYVNFKISAQIVIKYVVDKLLEDVFRYILDNFIFSRPELNIIYDYVLKTNNKELINIIKKFISSLIL